MNKSQVTWHKSTRAVPGKGTPWPLQLVGWAGPGSLEEMAAPVLSLSKMEFNSDSPYTSVPVTIHVDLYAKWPSFSRHLVAVCNLFGRDGVSCPV